MEHRQLAIYLAKAISNGSRYYQATLTKKPRIYFVLKGNRKAPCYRHGIIIERYTDTYWLKSRAFLFLPDLIRYIRHLSVMDKGFAERVKSHTLSPDDIEQVINSLTYGQIKLFMRGRKKLRNDASKD